MNRKLLLLTVMPLIILMISCAANHETEDLRNQCARLIDTGSPKQCIALAESEAFKVAIKKDEIQRIKASAFASLSGIKIAKLIRFANELEKLEEDLSQVSLDPEEQAHDDTAKRLNYRLAELTRHMINISSAIRVFHFIPTLDSEQSSYLNMALKLMDSIEDRTIEDHVFLAILRLVNLKNLSLIHLIGDFIEAESETKKDTKRCNINLLRFSRNLMELNDNYLSLMESLSNIRPEDAKKYSALAKQFERSLDNFSVLVSSIAMIDQFAFSVLSSDLQSSYLKGATCD